MMKFLVFRNLDTLFGKAKCAENFDQIEADLRANKAAFENVLRGNPRFIPLLVTKDGNIKLIGALFTTVSEPREVLDCEELWQYAGRAKKKDVSLFAVLWQSSKSRARAVHKAIKHKQYRGDTYEEMKREKEDAKQPKGQIVKPQSTWVAGAHTVDRATFIVTGLRNEISDGATEREGVNF